MCKLIDKFDKEQIAWKCQTYDSDTGKWALIVPYLKAQAIQNRLDAVFGFDGWKDEYKIGDGYVICYLSVWSDKHKGWITKENVCEIETEPNKNNPIKSAYSGALKRVASSGFGIGRYLKEFTLFANEILTEKPISQEINNYVKCEKKGAKAVWAKIPENDSNLYADATPKINKVPEIDEKLPKKPTEVSKKEIDPTKNNKDLISQETAIQITKYIKSKFPENEGKVILGIRRAFNISDFKELTKQQHEIIINCQFDIEKIKKAV